MTARFDDRDRRLLDDVAACPEPSTLEDMTRRDLAALTERRGIDFATALLYDRLRRSPTHGATVRQIESCDADGKSTACELPWVIVPGAFYREHPKTGADGAALHRRARELGIVCEIVPIESFGSLDTNATILREHLLRRADEPCLLISLSKGSLEVRRLMERPDTGEIFRPVRAWLNLAGLVCGSPLVSWLLQRPLRAVGVRAALWWRGYDFNVVRELNRTETLASAGWRLPATMQAVHVVGFPLKRHLSSALMRRGHRRLAKHGPNDGAGILLADVVDWPGTVYPVWGADHYLRTSHDDLSTLAARVLHYLDLGDRSMTSPPPVAAPCRASS